MATVSPLLPQPPFYLVNNCSRLKERLEFKPGNDKNKELRKADYGKWESRLSPQKDGLVRILLLRPTLCKIDCQIAPILDVIPQQSRSGGVCFIQTKQLQEDVTKLGITVGKWT
jgi:hypothetical protein